MQTLRSVWNDQEVNAFGVLGDSDRVGLVSEQK